MIFLREANNDINFYNFPNDFNKTDNYFTYLIEEASKKVEINFPIDIYGCYPEISFIKKVILFSKSRISDSFMTEWLNHQQGVVVPFNSKAFNIWATFENRRPPINNFDLTFSYDIDDYDKKNYYLPLFYLYMNIGDSSKAIWKHKETPSTCMTQRDLGLDFFANKTGFVSSFINNPHPTRIRAISGLSEIAEVSVFGRSVGNYVEDKIGMAGKFWFNLCFENDLYPGWVTEKVLEAWLAGAIPLYWGLDSLGLLNPKAIINLNDFPTMKDFIAYVGFLYKNPQKMIEIINEPLLLKDFKQEEVTNFLVNGLRNRVAR